MLVLPGPCPAVTSSSQPPLLQRMLETMDKDHSGAVEFEEFLQVRLQSLASTCGLPP